MKTVFTTGEAAKICKVSQQTIIRCFDNGTLKGFRVPGSRFRRIPRECLYRFMKKFGIPTDALEGTKTTTLIVDARPRLELLQAGLVDDGRFDVHVSENLFDGGMTAKSLHARLLIIADSLPGFDLRRILPWLGPDQALQGTTLVVLTACPVATQEEGYHRVMMDEAGSVESIQELISVLAEAHKLGEK